MCTKSLEECRLLVTYRDGGTNSTEKTALWSPPSTKSCHYSSILLFSEREDWLHDTYSPNYRRPWCRYPVSSKEKRTRGRTWTGCICYLYTISLTNGRRLTGFPFFRFHLLKEHRKLRVISRTCLAYVHMAGQAREHVRYVALISRVSKEYGISRIIRSFLPIRLCTPVLSHEMRRKLTYICNLHSKIHNSRDCRRFVK